MATPHLRTWSLAVGTAVVLSLSIGSPTASAPASVHEPAITFVGEATPQAREMIAWAVDRFAAAGLQLPDLQIAFPTYCSGKRALYHSSGPVHGVDFCRIAKRTILHEFAHAWDDTSGAVDRPAFMELRGVTVWFGGIDTPSDDQGAEHLAEIVSWGLMDGGSTIPLIPNNSTDEMTAAFEMVTGRVPHSLLEVP